MVQAAVDLLHSAACYFLLSKKGCPFGYGVLARHR